MGLELLSFRSRIPGYWSLAGYAKSKVMKAVSFIVDFEQSVVHDVEHRGLDGVICGHIHAAALKSSDRVVDLRHWREAKN